MLLDTMFAYAGTYSIDGDRIIHHVDLSWNELWTGTDQVRLIELDKDILTLSTDLRDPVTGVESHYAVQWEKVAGKDVGRYAMRAPDHAGALILPTPEGNP